MYETNASIVLLPVFVQSRLLAFGGWFTDRNLSVPFSCRSSSNSSNSSNGGGGGDGDCVSSISGPLTLYARLISSGDYVEDSFMGDSGANDDGNNNKGGASAGLIAGVTVACVVVAGIAAVIIVFFILISTGKMEAPWKSGGGGRYGNSRKNGDIQMDVRGSATRTTYNFSLGDGGGFGDGAMVAAEYKNSLNGQAFLYPEYYRIPTLKAALTSLGIPAEEIEDVAYACTLRAGAAARGGKLFEGFTEDDAAALAMYTYDFGSSMFEYNPYRLLNTALVGRNTAGLARAKDALYLVMTALRKLPKVRGRILYRGVRSEVNLDKDHYHEGNIITWPAFSSTSPDSKATKAFLSSGSVRGKKASGVFFIIENGWGYNIQPYSMFPDEEEILLEPERQFKVKSVIESEDFTVITLFMLKSPTILPAIFGEESE